AQVFEATALRAARWARGGAGVFEFVDRGRLLKVFEHFRIVGDMITIKSIRTLRHDFHRLIPTLGRFLCWTIGTHDSFEASGNHDFQIPFGEHWIGILPCENLALLGDANLSRKISRWLRENG